MAEAQEVTASEAYFFPVKADIAPKDDNRSHYQAYIIESADDGDAVLASAKEKGMSGIDSEKKVAVDSDKLAWQDVISEYRASSIANPGIFSPADFDLTDNAYLVVFYHTDGVASEVCVLGADAYDLEIKGELVFDADDFDPDEYNSGWQAMPPPVTVDALSNTFALDLTAGDRIAADEETLVVDPAWGRLREAPARQGDEIATVDIAFGGSTVETRTYNCASNDLWDTTALAAGRYTLALTAGTDNEAAAFWKTGDDWVIFDSSNITADVTFEAGKTYLFFGANTVDATLTVEDGAKFAYGEGAPSGFRGEEPAELPKRYKKETVGDLYQIVEKIKGSEDNPWDVGVGVEAYTNGNVLVIVGEGTIADLKEIPAGVKGGITAVTVADATDAAAGSFFGFDGVTVTLPDNWQGELPDDEGNWYGAEGVTLTGGIPLAVKNVTSQQRYPWNGKVDVDFDLTGEGDVKVTVQVTVDGKKLKNPTVDGETTFDLGKGKELKDLKLTWDAKADFGDAEKHEKIKVKLTVSPVEPD